jgi:hypothetical protein
MEILNIILIYLSINGAGGIHMATMPQNFTSYETCRRYQEKNFPRRDRSVYVPDFGRDYGEIRIDADDRVRVYSSCVQSRYPTVDPLLDDKYMGDRICCMALTPECLACKDGITVGEWKDKNCTVDSRWVWDTDVADFIREEACVDE